MIEFSELLLLICLVSHCCTLVVSAHPVILLVLSVATVLSFVTVVHSEPTHTAANVYINPFTADPVKALQFAILV